MPTTGELEEQLPLVSPVGRVPDMTRQLMAIRAGHSVDPHARQPISVSNLWLQSEKQGVGENVLSRDQEVAPVRPRSGQEVARVRPRSGSAGALDCKTRPRAPRPTP